MGFNNSVSSAYGDVVILLKPEVWQSRAWFSQYSGWWATRRVVKQIDREIVDKNNAIAGANELKLAQLEYSKMIFAASDIKSAFAALAVLHLRSKAPAILSQFERARSDDELIQLMNNYGFSTVEGKITDFVLPRDFQSVLLPSGASIEIRNQLKRLGIDFRMPN